MAERRERRGGPRFYAPCAGSGATLVYEKDGKLYCPYCGKQVQVTVNGFIFRHKALSKVVQEWERDR